MISEKHAELSHGYQVGDAVFINDKEWMIAEITADAIELQRDSIDGTSRTITMTPAEIRQIVKDSQHTLSN